MKLLRQYPILIAEDEAIIALDLALAVEAAGGEVVGPAATVKQAFALLKTKKVRGAILDVNLVDGDISPIAIYLLDLGIPVILQTGVGIPTELAARFPNLVAHIKPNRADKLVAELASMITERGKSSNSV